MRNPSSWGTVFLGYPLPIRSLICPILLNVTFSWLVLPSLTPSRGKQTYPHGPRQRDSNRPQLSTLTLDISLPGTILKATTVNSKKICGLDMTKPLGTRVTLIETSANLYPLQYLHPIRSFSPGADVVITFSRFYLKKAHAQRQDKHDRKECMFLIPPFFTLLITRVCKHVAFLGWK